MAATAHYFGKVGKESSVEEWFDAAMSWNEEAYAPALLRGDRPVIVLTETEDAARVSFAAVFPADIQTEPAIDRFLPAGVLYY